MRKNRLAGLLLASCAALFAGGGTSTPGGVALALGGDTVGNGFDGVGTRDGIALGEGIGNGLLDDGTGVRGGLADASGVRGVVPPFAKLAA